MLGALLAGVLIGIINLLLSKANSELFLVDSQSVVISTLATIGVNLIMFSDFEIKSGFNIFRPILNDY